MHYRYLPIIIILLFSHQAAHGADPHIHFSFEKMPLTELIDIIGQEKNINIIVPQGAADLEILKKQTITYHPRTAEKISLKKAWALLETFLELSGFSIIKKNDTLYEIVRHKSIEGGGVQRAVLPLYAETRVALLPQDDTRIHYLTFLRNLLVPSSLEKDTHPLTKMLKQLLTNDSPILYDTKSNGILLTDKASHIISLIDILKQFDSRGFTEAVAYVPIHNMPVSSVIAVFDSLKKASAESAKGPALPGPALQGPAFIRSGPDADTLTHFARDTQFIADTRHNAVIIMGRQANVDRITEFIQDSLDKPAAKGNSILHFYDLQYLDAQTFAPALQQIVSTLLATGQAQQAPSRQGREHQFKGVQVIAEPIIEVATTFTTENVIIPVTKGTPEKMGIEGVSTRGGNRLIIAARQDDWKIIKPFIEKLDKPQYTVILEILLVDFTYSDSKQVAGDLRSKTNGILPNGVQFLSSHITPVTNVLGTTPTQLAEDLLQVVGPQSVANQLTPGSLLVSINDQKTPGIFGLLEILSTVLKAKVTSYPYLMMTNHKKGVIESSDIRRLQGDLVTTQGGTFTIPIEDVQATIKVVATPHVITDTQLRLDIGFMSEAFIGTHFTRLTRGLKTTATLSSGQILVLGGLLRNDATDINTKTPFLGDIPLLGVFFRSNNQSLGQTNVTLFVLPTIIEPRDRTSLTKKTEKRICLSEPEDIVMDTEIDPIFRLFFKSPENRLANQFYAETTNLTSFKMESCNARTVKMLTPSQRKTPVRQYTDSALKELLAHEHEPFLPYTPQKSANNR